MTTKEAIEYIEALKNSDEILDFYYAEEFIKAFEMAINALGKQIPKKPINYDKYYYKCPYCEQDLSVDDDSLYVYEDTMPNYCSNCGQRLDWSDE